MDIVGGYNAAAKGSSLITTLKDLPKHYRVRVSFSVFFLDSWDNEYF